MIISHKYKFIFVHNRKCAGSSIASCLYPHLGPSDIYLDSIQTLMNYFPPRKFIVRDIFLNPEGLGMFALKGGARAITRRGSFEGVLRDALYSSYKKHFPETQSPIFPNASEVQKAFPYEWKNYYKFCFVRNPYSKMVSDYFWRRSLKGSKAGFDEFVRRAYFESIEGKKQDDLLPNPITNWPLYTIDDNVVMDYIGFFESLSIDFSFVASKLNLPVDAMDLPELKKRSGVSDYRDMYTEVSRELVYRLCNKEIDEHEYSF